MRRIAAMAWLSAVVAVGGALCTTGCRSEGAGPGAATTGATAGEREAAERSASSAAPGKGPAPGRALTEEGKMQIGPDDRCPVCAMKVAEHPKFASAIQLGDGRTYYFCGTGCMLRSWLHPEAFLGVDQGKLRRAVVRDYFTGSHVDAAGVTWVAGSDVVGPMGPALVPVGDDEAVARFEERHGGKARFTLADLDDALWEKLTGRKAGR